MADKKKKADALKKAEQQATEKKKEQRDKASGKKKDKPNVFVRIGRGIKRFIKDLRGETKKIIWTDRKSVVKNTGVVLLVILVIGAGVWIVDLALSESIKGIRTLKPEAETAENSDKETTTKPPAGATTTGEGKIKFLF